MSDKEYLIEGPQEETSILISPTKRTKYLADTESDSCMEMVSMKRYEELSTETETPRFGGAAPIQTNRMKAIIFANLFSLFQFLTACSMKLVIN